MMHFPGGFWIWGLINLGILLAWLVLSIAALIDLRGRKLSVTAKALWTVIALVIPIMGSLALFIVNPSEEPSPKE